MSPLKQKIKSEGKIRASFLCLITTVLLVLMLITFSSCIRTEKQGDSASNDGKLNIVTTIFPQYDFVREIAGLSSAADGEGLCNVSMLVKPGAESHTFMPSVEDLVKIEQCDLMICVGGDTDSWVDSEILPAIDMSGKKVLYLTEMTETVCLESEHSHEHTDDEANCHGETDDHVWTSPVNAKLITKQICDAMCELDSKNEAVYRKNAENYCKKLDSLDTAFKELIVNAPQNTVVIGDRFPFAYFAKEYGLEYYAAFKGCSSSSEPTLSVINELVEVVKDNQITAVFTIEFSNGKTAEAICKETGAKRLTLHSCHNVTKQELESNEGYYSLMQKNLENLREALYE